MRFIADFHVHSRFSRATSKSLTLESYHLWARLKGITVVGTGDFTHPGWMAEIEEKLEPAEDGLFRLKDEYEIKTLNDIPLPRNSPVRFVLTSEISNIYKKDGRVRKVHNLIFLPDLDAVKRFNTRLGRIGNLSSDGRPILGLDSHHLLEILMEITEDAFLVPAHIWTPWFSVLGSKSGFEAIEECFGDLTRYIFAVETGLSSDPSMNWRVRELDQFTLISDSDAHSADKLGREANLFDTALSLSGMRRAMEQSDKGSFLGTIEFFPEEGKYHYDGHRKCQVRLSPKETLNCGGICPVCNKKLTLGVMNRVERLATREEGEKPGCAAHYSCLIPLKEVLGEIFSVGPSSKRVKNEYMRLLQLFGLELDILLNTPIDDLRESQIPLLPHAIGRIRDGEVRIRPGYDGEYGTVTIFSDEERRSLSSQKPLFSIPYTPEVGERDTTRLLKVAERGVREEMTKRGFGEWAKGGVRRDEVKKGDSRDFRNTKGIMYGLNPLQRMAVTHTDGPLIVTAGPGTGKTKTLAHRIAYLIGEKAISPRNILAVTFTNKASGEMGRRLSDLLVPLTDPEQSDSFKGLTVSTFHTLGLSILKAEIRHIGRSPGFSVIGRDESMDIIGMIRPSGKGFKNLSTICDHISRAKAGLLTPEECGELEPFGKGPELVHIYQQYQKSLKGHNLLDLDDLILLPVVIFKRFPEILKRYQDRFLHILVDEYQDINHAQYELIRLLAPARSNICVIGDPDQAIYGFRGANRGYFLKFKEDYPDARVVRLNETYRSTECIVKATGGIIGGLSLTTHRGKGDIIDIIEAPTERAEAETVVHHIERLIGGVTFFSRDSDRVIAGEDSKVESFSDIAIFYRMEGLSPPIEEALFRAGIPYQRVGERSFLDSEEVLRIISLLRLLVNPEGLKDTPRIKECLSNASDKDLIGRLKGIMIASNITDIIDALIMETGLTSYDEGEDTAVNINRLKELAASFKGNLKDFLDYLTLQKGVDLFDPRAEMVTLMTIHASKGLEFPVVFIVGCEEGVIPYIKYSSDPEGIAEERRLFYVGATRARERLILLHSRSRRLFGRKAHNPPSRFLKVIREDLKRLDTISYRKKRPGKDTRNGQMDLF